MYNLQIFAQKDLFQGLLMFISKFKTTHLKKITRRNKFTFYG